MILAHLAIEIDLQRIAAFCCERGIRKLSLFGSVLRDDFDPQRSDLDVLVELRPDAHPGFAFFGWHEELAELIGRMVDLLTAACLSPYFRDEVLREAITIYEQA